MFWVIAINTIAVTLKYLYLLIFSSSLFFLLFTSKFINLYFILELHWMTLIILFIQDNSVWRGILAYLILNASISIFLLIGLVFSNSLFFLIGIYGKIGFFPFFLLYSNLLFSASYLFFLIDVITKWAYLISFILIFNEGIFYVTFGFWLVIINLIAVTLVIRMILSIKHLLLLSSLILFLLCYLLLLIEEEFFLFLFVISYSFVVCSVVGYLVVGHLINVEWMDWF